MCAGLIAIRKGRMKKSYERMTLATFQGHIKMLGVVTVKDTFVPYKVLYAHTTHCFIAFSCKSLVL